MFRGRDGIYPGDAQPFIYGLGQLGSSTCDGTRRRSGAPVGNSTEEDR